MATNSKVEGIINALRSRIVAGEFGVEGRLPSFRSLATEYDTTQETMNKTMQALQAEGLLLSMGAKGVFVNNIRIRLNTQGVVNDFSEYIKEQGFIPKGEIIDKPEIIDPPSDVQKHMKLKKGQKVLLRQRKQGTENFMLRVTLEYYPAHFITEAMLEQINKDPNFSIIHAIKINFKKTIESAHEEVIARLPNSFEQEQLQIVRTNPVIEIKSANFTADEKTAIIYYHKVLNANHFILSYKTTLKYL